MTAVMRSRSLFAMFDGGKLSGRGQLMDVPATNENSDEDAETDSG